MGRSPCCDEEGIKKGPWTPEEDQKLVDFIQRNGHGSWRALPKLAGLNRCGKSCRLRWTNYLRPDIKRGRFTEEEEQIIIKLHSHLGNKWSAIATRLPGRTDNEIKNYWNTHLKKKLLQMGIDPVTHKPRTDLSNLLGSITHLLMASNLGSLVMNQWDSALVDAAQLARMQWLQSLLAVMGTSSAANSNPPSMEAASAAAAAANLMASPPLAADGQFGEFNRSNCQLNGLILDGSLNIPGQFDHLDMGNAQELQCHYQPLDDQSCSSSVHGSGLKLLQSCSDFNAISDQNKEMGMPSCGPATAFCADHPAVLASGSSASDKVEAALEHMVNNPAEISAHSSASTTFEAWGELNLDDQASNYCWADIIDQTSSPSWRTEL